VILFGFELKTSLQNLDYEILMRFKNYNNIYAEISSSFYICALCIPIYNKKISAQVAGQSQTGVL
jgi:hypothetical protein